MNPTHLKVVRLDLKKCNLQENLIQNKLENRNIIHEDDPTQLKQGFDENLKDESNSESEELRGKMSAITVWLCL